MKIGIMFSSGKDSCLTYHHYWKQKWDIACLVTLLPPQGSYMFQKPAKKLVKMQAKSMSKPVVFKQTKGEKERELEDLKTALLEAKETYGIEGVGVGALASNYQNNRVKQICDELNLKVCAPLWQIPQEEIMRKVVDTNFDARMTSVSALGLDASWIGKKITHEDVNKLVEINKKCQINIAGEGGEFETVVLNAPFFLNPLEVIGEVITDGEHEAHWDIKEVKISQNN